MVQWLNSGWFAGQSTFTRPYVQDPHGFKSSQSFPHGSPTDSQTFRQFPFSREFISLKIPQKSVP